MKTITVQEAMFKSCAILLCSFLVSTLANSSTTGTTLMGQDGHIHNCSYTRKPTKVKVAYRGWPFTLYWKELHAEFKHSLPSVYDYYDSYSYHSLPSEKSFVTTECVVWDLDQDKVVYNATYDTDSGYYQAYKMEDMQTNSSLNFEIVLSVPGTESCLATRVHINLTDLPINTCAEAMALANPISRQSSVGENAIFSCSVPQSESPQLTAGKHTTHKWLRDCSELPKHTTPRSRKGLQINNVTYEHPGVYTCAVTHNKQTWYTVHHNLCVRPRNVFYRHHITCITDIVYAGVGDRASLVCTGYLSNGDHNPIGLTIDWKMKPTNDSNLTRCENPATLQSEEAPSINNPDAKCAYSMSKLPCFDHIPSQNERDVKSQTITMQLELNNLKETDFGEYEVTLKTASFHLPPVTATVTLKVSATPILMKASVAIGVSLGAVLVVSTFALVSYFLHRKRNKQSVHEVKRSKSTDDTNTITDSIAIPVAIAII